MKEIAPMLNIDLTEFKATKKVIEENFKKIMKQQLVRKSQGSKMDEQDT